MCGATFGCAAQGGMRIRFFGESRICARLAPAGALSSSSRPHN
jgi:hypothetical protein